MNNGTPKNFYGLSVPDFTQCIKNLEGYKVNNPSIIQLPLNSADWYEFMFKKSLTKQCFERYVLHYIDFMRTCKKSIIIVDMDLAFQEMP